MLKLNSPLASQVADVDGQPAQVGPHSFMLRTLLPANRKYLVVAATLQEKNPDDRRPAGVVFMENLPELLADAVVAGWDPATVSNDEGPIQYSQEAALQLFTDHVELSSAVFKKAQELTDQAEKSQEEQAAELGKSLPLTASGGNT